jgi:hypothetical protein
VKSKISRIGKAAEEFRDRVSALPNKKEALDEKSIAAKRLSSIACASKVEGVQKDSMLLACTLSHLKARVSPLEDKKPPRNSKGGWVAMWVWWWRWWRWW